MHTETKTYPRLRVGMLRAGMLRVGTLLLCLLLLCLLNFLIICIALGIWLVVLVQWDVDVRSELMERMVMTADMLRYPAWMM